MPRPTPWTDEYTLLCERCGYVLEGLAGEKCPECGKPVAESRPEVRKGTVWQREWGVVAWCRVNWSVLRHPRRTFREMWMFETWSAWSLLFFNLLLGAVICGGLLLWVNRGDDFVLPSYYTRRTSPPSANPPWPANMPFIWTGVGPGSFTFPALDGQWNSLFGLFMMLVPMLVWIESLGVRFFGRQRGWRVTKSVAWNVCCHASIGWTIGCLLLSLTPLGLICSGWVLDLLPAQTAINIAVQYARWSPIAALFVGMLIFETLVYVGVRECRFANRARPGVAAGGDQADERPDDKGGDSPPPHVNPLSMD